MKILKIMKDFWYRLKWIIKHGFITLIGWAKVIILGVLIIGYFALKETFERREK